jgi:hypothetical protein
MPQPWPCVGCGRMLRHRANHRWADTYCSVACEDAVYARREERILAPSDEPVGSSRAGPRPDRSQAGGEAKKMQGWPIRDRGGAVGQLAS